MEAKSQRLAMPPTEARMQEAVLSILRLPQLMELKVMVTGIEVKRGVEGDEPVVPETILDISKGLVPDVPDVEFLLKQLEIEALRFDTTRAELHTLLEMTQKVVDRGLFCCAWYVAQGNGLDYFLANPRGTMPAALFGIPVHYVSTDDLPEGKLLLVGSTSRYPIDSVYGVSADIGG
jgi:hypothetical protein